MIDFWPVVGILILQLCLDQLSRSDLGLHMVLDLRRVLNVY